MILIVGQGIAGSLLAWNLFQKNIPFHITSNPNIKAASHVAAGLINPVTGKRLAVMNDFPTYYDSAQQTYQEIEQFFQVPIWKSIGITRVFHSEEVKNFYQQKIQNPNTQNYFSETFDFVHNGCINGESFDILGGARVNLFVLLEILSHFFQSQKLSIPINLANSQAFANYDKVIFCRGAEERNHELFPDLKWECTKGEMLIAHIPNLNLAHILQFDKNTLIPLGNDLYWFGATYLQDLDSETEEDIMLQNLKSLVTIPFRVIRKINGIRPILQQRKPQLITSPINSKFLCLNGFGSKGTLMAPEFCKRIGTQFKNNILNLKPDLYNLQQQPYET